MKKLIIGMCAAVAAIAFAETAAISIGEGGAWNADACRLAAIRAASTNATGTVEVKRIARHVHRWTETVFDTNTIWSINYVTNGIGGTATNIIYAYRQVARTADIVATNTLATLTLSGGFAQTNMTDIALMPGDTVTATGTGMDGGAVRLLVWR